MWVTTTLTLRCGVHLDSIIPTYPAKDEPIMIPVKIKKEDEYIDNLKKELDGTATWYDGGFIKIVNCVLCSEKCPPDFECPKCNFR